MTSREILLRIRLFLQALLRIQWESSSIEPGITSLMMLLGIIPLIRCIIYLSRRTDNMMMMNKIKEIHSWMQPRYWKDHRRWPWIKIASQDVNYKILLKFQIIPSINRIKVTRFLLRELSKWRIRTRPEFPRFSLIKNKWSKIILWNRY